MRTAHLPFSCPRAPHILRRRPYHTPSSKRQRGNARATSRLTPHSGNAESRNSPPSRRGASQRDGYGGHSSPAVMSEGWLANRSPVGCCEGPPSLAHILASYGGQPSHGHWAKVGGQGRNRTADTAIFRRGIKIEEIEKVGAFSRDSPRFPSLALGRRWLKCGGLWRLQGQCGDSGKPCPRRWRP